MKDLLQTNVDSFIKVSVIFADAYLMKEGFYFVMENNGKDKENAWKIISLSKNWNKNSMELKK